MVKALIAALIAATLVNSPLAAQEYPNGRSAPRWCTLARWDSRDDRGPPAATDPYFAHFRIGHGPSRYAKVLLH